MKPCGPSSHSDNLTSLAGFLSGPLVSALFAYHPNDIGTSSFQPPAEWSDWWDWAGLETHDLDGSSLVDPWLLLLQYYDWCRVAPEGDANEHPPDVWATIPHTLRALVENACRQAIPREPGRVVFPCLQKSLHPSSSSSQEATTWLRQSIARSSTRPLPGMSPKKAHEVVQMSDFIGSMLRSYSSLSSVKHVVDVGAGQAYLSRALRDSHGLHVLALDFSDVQTQGAAKRDVAKSTPRALPNGSRDPSAAHATGHAMSEQIPSSYDSRGGSLTYVTTKIDSDTLHQSTHAWMKCNAEASCNTQDCMDERSPTPVLFVALHACGSLTLDILRTFTAAACNPKSSAAIWIPRAAVIVGCCYNMLRPEDFPLSQVLRSMSGPTITLGPSHLQLAAQVPSQWTRSGDTLRDARLALRKIVWRALIQDVLDGEQGRPVSGNHTNTHGDTGTFADGRQNVKRLGRLNDAAYADWATFAHRVQTKLGLLDGQLVRADGALERRIAVFHVLRCIVGPVIESLLLLDRALWVQDTLQGTGLEVELVNLFDQTSGSGRNVAIVICPGLAR